MIDLMTYEDYKMLLSGEAGTYYRGRWEYFKEVIALIQPLSLSTILEIGPGYLPLVKNADLLLHPQDDHFGKPGDCPGKIIIHDVTVKPWPIDDRAYDLVIALQVWEHLDNKQPRAFRELKRITKRAILSVPYQWVGGMEKPMHRLHRDIDRELIADWTLNIPPQREMIIPRTGAEFSKGPRFVGYWDFTEGESLG
jgi:SAM-dependent methyltransferase